MHGAGTYKNYAYLKYYVLILIPGTIHLVYIEFYFSLFFSLFFLFFAFSSFALHFFLLVFPTVPAVDSVGNALSASLAYQYSYMLSYSRMGKIRSRPRALAQLLFSSFLPKLSHIKFAPGTYQVPGIQVYTYQYTYTAGGTLNV